VEKELQAELETSRHIEETITFDSRRQPHSIYHKRVIEK
jgi:hypothetical protein